MPRESAVLDEMEREFIPLNEGEPDVAPPPDEVDRIEPLDRLHAQRRKIEKEYHPLWALYGPGGVWDSVRKALLDSTAAKIRKEALDAGRKVTDGSIDEAAHAHKEYQDFLVTSVTERQTFSKLSMDLQEIEDRIRRGDALLRLSAAEARLAQ